MRRDYLESRQQAHVLNPNYSVIFYKGERFGKGLKASRLFIHMTEQGARRGTSYDEMASIRRGRRVVGGRRRGRGMVGRGRRGRMGGRRVVIVAGVSDNLAFFIA